MTNKTDQINDLMRREGWDKYTNDPDDRGGPTRWGITEKTARKYGYTGDMKSLPYDKAFSIYSIRYWDSQQLDSIEAIDEDLAVYMFDYGVNSGIYESAGKLQELLNVLNNQEAYYDDIETDGIIGIQTLTALRGFIARRGTSGRRVLREVYNALRIEYLFSISQGDESQEKYTFGWFKRVVDL